MDRQVIYAGAIALDTDQLLQSRNTMIGLGYLAKMLVGDGAPCADGLQCTPATGLSVSLAAGSLTAPTVVDAGYVGALPPDGDPLVKTGINTTPVVVTLGGSGTFLISGTMVATPAGNIPMAYYNAADPAQALIGPGGNGEPQASILQQRIVFTADVAGGAPSGGVPLWKVTVPAGAAAILPAMISPAPGAPFLAVKLPQAAPLLSPAFAGTPSAPTRPRGDVSTLLATTAFVSGANRRGRAVWTSAGDYAWTCPIGVVQILFRGWGAGGAGGSGSGGMPGGGGGYLEVLLDVVSGQSYLVVVGSGATGFAAVTPSGFGGLLSIFGGGNGGSGGGGQAGDGGTPGSDAVLQLEALSNPGTGPGQAGYLAGGTQIGGAGGSSYGTSSGNANTGGGAGVGGCWPGGGGSGGVSGAGGNGADGLVILEWAGDPGP